MQKERSSREKKGLVSSDNRKLSVRKQCYLLEINRSGIYYKPVEVSAENFEIMRLMDRHNTYHPDEGVIGMRNMLMSRELIVNHKRIRRLMRLMDIKAIYPKRNLTKSNKSEYKYPYLLRNMDITRPNQVWSIDITYIAMASGFMYLTAIIDAYSRFIVGWHVGNSLDAEVSVNVLKDAIARYGKPEIVNSDQGSQYTSAHWVNCLQDPSNAIKISMDGKGRATDNFWIERFWRTIKRGHIYLHPAENGTELHHGVRHYIEYYNHSKGHTAHNGLPPALAYGVPRPSNVESSKKALNYINLPDRREILQIN